jgi:hypothetical protein
VAVVTPPPQLYVAPAVVDEAVIVTLVTLQVRVAGGAMLTFGGVIVWETVTEADAVHPLAGSVTVTVYVPGAVTVLAAVVTPPPQLYVTPAVVDEAVIVILATLQVSVAGGAMLTFGGAIVWETVTEAVALHPLPGLVTVTV